MMNKFQFTPPTGLLDTSAYPTNPATEAEARGQIQDPLNQIKNYLNLFLDAFAFSKNVNGYTKLPNGFILQWGEVFIGNGATANLTFPIVFPTTCSKLIGSLQWSSPSSVVLAMNKIDNKSFQCIPSSATAYTVNWIAIGY